MGYKEVWGVKILIIIICNNYVIFKKSNKRNMMKISESE